MTDQQQITYVAEEVTEIRYKPSGSFLNLTGQIADFIEAEGIFPHWEIDHNSVSFRDNEKSPKQLSAFISFRNAGYVCFDAPTQNFFVDKATAFWKTLERNKLFRIPEIQRVGVRNRCFVKSEKSFEEIEEKLFSALFASDITKRIGGERKDLQVVFDLIEGDKNIRLTIGPLHSEEARKHFRFDSEHFSSCGLFIDVDIYKQDKSNAKDVTSFIKQASAISWEKISVIALMLGE